MNYVSCTCKENWKNLTWTRNGPTPHQAGCPDARTGYRSTDQANAATLAYVLGEAAATTDLLPINNEGWQLSCTHEERILDHCISRLRLGQPQPIYRLGDREFDRLVKRQRLTITHATMPDGSRVPHTVYSLGTTAISVVAGGPFMSEVQIDLVEGAVAREPSPWECPVCGLEIFGMRFWRAVGQRLVCAQCVRKASA